MNVYDRSGFNLNSLWIGTWQCLRQELMTAGEVMKASVRGGITFQALRAPISVGVHMSLAAFYTPLRYLDSTWTQFVIDGVDGSLTMPRTSVTTRFESLGLGNIAPGFQFPRLFLVNWNRIHNWYMRWPDYPEVNDFAVPSATASPVGSGNYEYRYGRRCVNLPNYATRLRVSTLDAADYQLEQSVASSKATLDIRLLEQLRARYRSEQARDWFSRRGYREVVESIWNQRPSRDAENRPHLVDLETAWVDGGNVWATEADELGKRTGVIDISVDHRFPTVVFPEAGVLSYWICFRTPPLYRTSVNPIASPQHDGSYVDWTGDPVILAKEPPVAIKRGVLDSSNATPTVAAGTYPRGQHLRTGWNSVGDEFNRGSRTNWMLQAGQANPEDLILHQDVSSAFLSKIEGLARAALKFEQISDSVVPPISTSIFAGG